MTSSAILRREDTGARVSNQEGSSVYYRSYGTGEPVLLIHGLGGSGADWALQIPALEPRFRVIVPDLPGCGSSPPPPGGYSIAGFARSLWSLLDRIEVRRINIVGFSMGGAVALEMALQRPALVPRLALINSLATYRDQWRKWMYARYSQALVHVCGMRRTAQIFAAGLFPEPWQEALRSRAAAVVAAVPARSYLSMLRALETWEAADLDRIRSRTLVIAAEHDHTPLEEKRELAARLRASIVVVHGSRHGTPFDGSQATNSSLVALLTDQPLPTCDRLACDSPTRAQAEFLAVRRRVLELLEDAEDSLGREVPRNGYLRASSDDADQMARPAGAGKPSAALSSGETRCRPSSVVQRVPVLRHRPAHDLQ